jgi:hypothetical protein
MPVDHTTDVYEAPADATTIELTAEIKVNPREGAGSSAVDRVDFYKEVEGALPQLIGRGTRISGTTTALFKLSYSAESHGPAGAARAYFANCVARSTQNTTKKVPSYSEPVLVRRAASGS